MPYCPKCDMEFVEGITVCTDCGGPLAESKEAALAQKEAEVRREEEKRLALLAEAEAGEAGEGESGEGGENAAEKKDALRRTPYKNKSDRCAELNSSAAAFFFVGALLALGVVLIAAGFLKLPMGYIQRMIFCTVLLLMAVGCIAVGISSRRSAGLLRAEAADEEQATAEIISWFLKTYDGAAMDQQLFSEDPELSGEELVLKRFELIQDYLVTGRDLPDQAYVDALCDTLYTRLYDDSRTA